jgi:hypothetical protein
MAILFSFYLCTFKGDVYDIGGCTLVLDIIVSMFIYVSRYHYDYDLNDRR